MLIGLALEAVDAPGCGRTLAASVDWTSRSPIVCGVVPNMCGDCLDAQRKARALTDAIGRDLLAVAAASAGDATACFDLRGGKRCDRCPGCIRYRANAALLAALREFFPEGS